MRTTRSLVAGSAAVAAVMTAMAAAPSIGASAPAHSGDAVASSKPSGLRAIGLTADGRLVRFDVKSPGKSMSVGSVSGSPATPGATLTCSMSSAVLRADAASFAVLDTAGDVVVRADLS